MQDLCTRTRSALRCCVRCQCVAALAQTASFLALQDGACERLAELALNDADVAGALLRQALAPCSSALAAIDPKLMQAAAAAFQQVTPHVPFG